MSHQIVDHDVSIFSFLILILEIRGIEQVSRFQQLLDFCSHKIDNGGYVLFNLLFAV